MAFLLLKRLVDEIDPGLVYDVTDYGHDTDTHADATKQYTRSTKLGNFTRSATSLAGSYCLGTSRVDVYHAAALDGTSRLETTLNAPDCPVGGGGGTGGGTGNGNPPPVPAGATLLLRDCDGEQGGGDFQRTDYYYDPATRAVVVAGPYNITVCQRINLPVTTVVDRYCLDQDQPPYTERVVHHDGFGGITVTDTDNVTTCQPRGCRLALPDVSITPESLRGGDGRVVSEATGAQGAVSYSLDNFQTPGQPLGDFAHLLAGEYTLSVRELRPQGCAASLAVTIPAPRSLRYTLPFYTVNDEQAILRFYLRGYTGPSEELTGAGESPLRIEWAGDGNDHVFSGVVRASAATINVLVTEDGQLADAYCPDDRTMLVVLSIEDVDRWSGYLAPDLCDAPHLAPPIVLQLKAVDGLAGLSEIPFAGYGGLPFTGRQGLLRTVQGCLSKLDLPFALHTWVNLFADGMADGPQEDPLAQLSVLLDGYQEGGKAYDCLKVLQTILHSFSARLYQWDNAWVIERLSDLNLSPLTYRAYDPAGNRLPNPAPITPLRSITLSTETSDPLYWNTGVQYLTARPAIGEVVVKGDPGEYVNVLPDSDWRPASFLPDGRLARWRGTAPHARVAPVKKNDPAGLKLSGVSYGTTSTAFLESAPFLAPGAFTVTFTAEFQAAGPYDFTLPDAQLPAFYLAAKVGNQWLRADFYDQTPASGPEPLAVRFHADRKSETVTLRFDQYGIPTDQVPCILRLYQPNEVGDVVLTGPLQVRLGEVSGLSADENYVDESHGKNTLAGRITRQDDSLTLRHVDIAFDSYLEGSFLKADGTTTKVWHEPADPQATPQQLIDYVVRDRLSWQLAPAQALSGLVRGFYRPGSLLTDPQELIPRVYATTDAGWDVALDRWEIIAVELLTLQAPAPLALDHVALLEDGSVELTEDGSTLLLEA